MRTSPYIGVGGLSDLDAASFNDLPGKASRLAGHYATLAAVGGGAGLLVGILLRRPLLFALAGVGAGVWFQHSLEKPGGIATPSV